MTGLLVTGFEPFGTITHNPSGAVLALLPDEIDGVPLTKRVLPVEAHGVGRVLAELHAGSYAAILHLGVAQERRTITVERRAKNHCDFPIPDNSGVTRRGPVIPGAPEHLRSRLPVEAILAALAKASIEAGPSDSAGAFVCNQVMFTSLHRLPASVPTGFIHLPPDETLGAGRPHQPLAQQAAAIRVALRVILRSCPPSLSV